MTTRPNHISPCGSRARADQGFSLIEVLLAIFIMGVGVISIAALFPAGIAQQRLSVDDINGPIVANNALSIIRGKLRADDFGTFEDFGEVATWNTNGSSTPFSGTIAGDWPWLRPSFLFEDDHPGTVSQSPAVPAGTPFDDTGSIDIFNFHRFNSGTSIENSAEFPGGFGASDPTLFGIPYNVYKWGAASPPRIIFTQSERYYPQVSRAYTGTAAAPVVRPSRPQYVWDCMFRRFQGRVLVAIFVYRVNLPGGSSMSSYTVPKNLTDFNVPPMPVSLDLTDGATLAFSAGGPWDAAGPDGVMGGPTGYLDNAIVLGTQNGTFYDAADSRQAWQEPRQWILDQNNNVHRVLGQTRTDYDASTDDVQVELSRPLSPVLGRNITAVGNPNWTGTPHFYIDDPTAFESVEMAERDIVTNLWYVPVELPVDIDGDGNEDQRVSLTPVYATVKEL